VTADSDLSVQTRATAERYLELATAGDADAIADLYAEDSEFLPIPPNEVIVRGREAIRQHYRDHVSTVHPKYESLNWMVDGLQCCVEIHAYVEGRDEHVYVVDIFTMTPDGLIARMAAYRRATG
jgi:hypothetical protein